MKDILSENLDVFAINCRTDLDLRFKGRLQRLIKARDQGCCESFNGDVLDLDSCHFDLMMNDISDQYEDFHFNGFDVLGHLDPYYQRQLFPTLEGLGYDEISAIYAFFMEDGFLCDPEKITDDEITECVLYTYDEDYIADGLHMVRDFLNAISYAEKGDLKKALSCTVFRQFCDDLVDSMRPYGCDDIGPELIAANSYYAFKAFVDGNEERAVRSGLYCSKEVYLYEGYRDMLPEDIRKQADAYVHVFKYPGNNEHTSFNMFGYTFVMYIVSQVYDRPGMEEQCFNTLFESAVKWLDSNLKNLREEYTAEPVLAAA